MKLSPLETAILKTIIFHSIFKIPLKGEEIFYFLYGFKTKPEDCQLAVNHLLQKNIINKKNSLYFLAGEEKILAERTKRVQSSCDRYQRVQTIIKKLSWLPFLKMVAITSSLSFDNTVPDSDIDLLIITKKNRLWLTRFLLVPFLDMWGVNKSFKQKKNKFCLGFWLDESGLNLQTILDHKNDLYAYYWLIRLRPIVGNNIHGTIQKENIWINKYLPNWKNDDHEKVFDNYQISLSNNLLKNFLEKFFNGWVGNGLEKLAKKIQIWRLWRVADNCQKKKWVIAKDSILKLPPKDILEYQKIYTKKWLQVVKRLS